MKYQSYYILLGVFVFAFLVGCRGTQSGDAKGHKDGEELSQVTLMLNWYPEAEHGGFYAAQVHGIFAKYGLDVEIRPGGPNAPVAQELVTGRVEFAIGNADDTLLFREQEVPVVALLAPIQNTPRCILVHESSSIQDLSQLAGTTLQAGNGRPYLEFMKAKGLLENVQVVPYTGVPSFVADESSAMQGYNFSEPLLAKQAGASVRMLMVSEIGFNPYASCLLTTDSYVNENEDVVRRMTRACREGWQKYLESPEETNQAILEANGHGMTQEALEFGVAELRPLCITESVPIQSIGLMEPNRWETLVNQFSELGLVDAAKVKAESVYSTKYLQDTTP